MAGGGTGKGGETGKGYRWLVPLAGVVLLLAGGLGWWTAPEPVQAQGPAAGLGQAQVAASGASASVSVSVASDLPGGALLAEASPAPEVRGARASLPAEEREARRFNRYDRNKDGVVSREEFLAARRKSFERLDRNGDGLLDFEEYAITTSARFDAADRNGDFSLSRSEFAQTATRTAAQQTAQR